ncbi:MAG: bifunctional phosphoribosylaminoimidazolecarboxamide formyltransferase/IMP cyclohydrolase [Clostridium sp.]|uniref:bifunctional phosphoribosylaminoimidazolecarboxamide formyltransferase/IMP cyclohydrolase n=1 Tax=Clostridium sp. TaxID=1506 RepID=UPI003D6D2FB1
MIKTALISVFDKNNVLELAISLQNNGVEIISTGGTFKYLKENGIKVSEISDVTGFEEILDGRVKTLHPIIHSGILAIRDNKQHMATIKAKGINTIDMVVVNLYPFFDKVSQDISFEEKVEFIDIGGPTMLRAAAKNFKDVIVLSDTHDYKNIIEKMDAKEKVDFDTRKHLAGKVFNLISAYDSAISNFLLGEDSYTDYLSISYKKQMDLRYGENPHQSAAYYVSAAGSGAMKDIQQLHGKELSYNNIKDMDIAWKVVCEFEETACCALKHNTPCGVATGTSVLDCYKKAHDCDPMSIFGGIVAFNKKVDKVVAQELAKIFLEVVIAPDFDDDALEVLEKKKNIRIIKCLSKAVGTKNIVNVDGGILVQSADNKLMEDIKIVTKKSPTDNEMKDMIFAMIVVKYVKSNAIVVVKDGVTRGIGAGQVNRIWAAEQALERAGDGTILASDAFFPFGDVVELAAKYNIKAIIQPGGSIKDIQSIDACDKNDISMVFTGIRHFKH